MCLCLCVCVCYQYTGATLPALIDDSVNSSHPLSSLTRVRQASEIDNYFDMISCECDVTHTHTHTHTHVCANPASLLCDIPIFCPHMEIKVDVRVYMRVCVCVCVCACTDQKGGAVLRMLRMYTAIAVSGGRAFTQPNLPMGNTVPAAGTATPTPFTASNISSLPLRRRMLGQESTHERDLQQGAWLCVCASNVSSLPLRRRMLGLEGADVQPVHERELQQGVCACACVCLCALVRVHLCQECLLLVPRKGRPGTSVCVCVYADTVLHQRRRVMFVLCLCVCLFMFVCVCVCVCVSVCAQTIRVPSTFAPHGVTSQCSRVSKHT